jgi:serine/threonine-protein kinase
MSIDPASDPRSRVDAARREQRTGVVTLVFTDIVGSTALKQQVGDRQAVALMQEHHAQVRALLPSFVGAREISSAGDSFFLVFAKPSEAVKFALLLLGRLRQSARAGLPALADRVGIHVGEVVFEQDASAASPNDFYGIHVDICARVMGLAGADQILLTRSAFDNARAVLRGEDVPGVGELRWANHGPYLLKGVEEPVEICEVRAAEGALTAPATTEKAQRHVSADAEPVLGWRPAVDQVVPNTQWLLERKLGEGGFGEVWLGRHRAMKERRVFKFCFRADRVRSLKREMTLFRVLKERVGEHPNIVGLREVYFDDPPFYVVMDYVEGRDLAQWCEQQGGADRVPLESKLEIAAQISDALQAAHDAGVIHRDVKPGNILVRGEGIGAKGETESGANGSLDQPITARPSPITAKLSDFGIGQVVSGQALEGITQTGFTQTIVADVSSSHAGSQMYMAPELLAGSPATTRSDIYSLGVVLYQLLTGDFKRPVTTDWAKDIPDALLRDDLKQCFAGNPHERFAGVGQLAQRLRRWSERRTELERQGLEQRAMERAAYRRGMLRAAGAAVLVVAVIAALAFAAREQSRRASAEAAKSRQIAAFLQEMLKGVGPSIAKGRDVTLLREILTNTVVRLDRELAGQPEAEAVLRLTLGRTYRDLGDYAAAEAMCRRALELRRRISGTRQDAVAEALNELAKPLAMQGKLVESERLAREALALHQARLGLDNLVAADMLNDLGVTLLHSGKLGEAKEVFAQTLAIRVKLLQEPDVKLAQVHLNLSLVCLELGEFVRGEEEARKALAGYRSSLGETDPSVGMALHNQAKLLRELGRLTDAQRAIRDAIAIYQVVYQDGHDYHAEALDDLGRILEAKGEPMAAEAAFRDGVVMGGRVVGGDHPQTLQTQRHLAMLLSTRPASRLEADDLMGRAMMLSRQKLAQRPAALAACLRDYAAFLRYTGRAAEAEPELLHAHRLLAEGGQPAYQQRRVCLALEQLYVTLGRKAEAEEWAAKAAGLTSP